MIARKTTVIFGVSILSALIGYIGIFFVARFMGPEALGIVGFGLAYVTLFSFIADLGFGSAHVKRISEGKDLATCIGTFARIKLVLILVMACFILGSILIWKFLFGRGFESTTHEYVLYIMVFYAVFIEISTFFIHTFSARKEIAKFQLPVFVETVSRVPVMIAVAVLGLSVIALAGAYVLGPIIMVVLVLWLFRNYPVGKYSKEYFKSYLGFALPIFLISAISVISVNIDKVMIQLFWSSTEVGYYFGVQRIVFFIVALGTGVTTLLFPTISAYHAGKDIKAIAELTQRAERHISMFIFPMAAFVIALAPQMIYVILSGEFLPAVPVIQMLAIYSLFVTINSPVWVQFGGINRPKLGAKIAGSGALLNIGLNLLFIPSAIFGIKLLGLGALGAALATVISACYMVVISRIAVKKLTGTTPYPKIFFHLLAACLTGLLLYLIGQLVPLDRIYSLVLAGLLGIGIYLLALYSLKEFTKEDYHFFLDTLSPRKMFRYMKEELKH